MLVRLGRPATRSPCSRPCWPGAPSAGSRRSGSGPRRGSGRPSCSPRTTPPAALALLRRAVSGMRRAHRHLELPAAAIFLAEAEWRAGDEDAHDAACEVAYAAAEACGTLRPLEQALALRAGGPRPAARLPRAPDERRWRALARAEEVVAAASPESGARLRVRTLGEPALELDGEPLPVRAHQGGRGGRLRRAGRARPGCPARRWSRSSSGAAATARTTCARSSTGCGGRCPRTSRCASGGGRLAWRPAEAVASRRRAAGVAGGPGPARGRRAPHGHPARRRRHRGPRAVPAGAGRRERRRPPPAPGRRWPRRPGSSTRGRCGRRAARARPWPRPASWWPRTPTARTPGRSSCARRPTSAGRRRRSRPSWTAERALHDVGLEPSRETRVLLERLRG